VILEGTASSEEISVDLLLDEVIMGIESVSAVGLGLMFSSATLGLDEVALQSLKALDLSWKQSVELAIRMTGWKDIRLSTEGSRANLSGRFGGSGNPLFSVVSSIAHFPEEIGMSDFEATISVTEVVHLGTMPNGSRGPSLRVTNEPLEAPEIDGTTPSRVNQKAVCRPCGVSSSHAGPRRPCGFWPSRLAFSAITYRAPTPVGVERTRASAPGNRMPAAAMTGPPSAHLSLGRALPVRGPP